MGTWSDIEMEMESDETLYLKATQETEGEDKNEALWAKSMALTEGDERKAKYNYIKLRVEQLKREGIRSPTSAQEELKIIQPASKEESDFHNKYISVSEYSELHKIPYQKVRKQLEEGTLNGAVKDGKQYVLHTIQTRVFKSSDNQVRTDIEKQYISAPEYAKLHNISEKTVYKLLDKNEILGKTINGQQYILRSFIKKPTITSSAKINPDYAKNAYKAPERKGIMKYLLGVVVSIIIVVIMGAIFGLLRIYIDTKIVAPAPGTFEFILKLLITISPLLVGMWLIKLSWKKITAD